MSFFYWIYETYIAKKRKRGKKTSVKMYQRDFKMFYCRVNSTYVGPNDKGEVIKIRLCLPTALISQVNFTIKVYQRYTKDLV